VTANPVPSRTRGLPRLTWVGLALLLAGCTVAPTRLPPPSAPPSAPPTTPAPAPRPAADPAGEPEAPATPEAPASAPTPPVAVENDDPWQRLRGGLRFADCANPDATMAAAQLRLLRDRAALQRQLRRVLPELDYVLGEVERQQLPAEFALLPLVESGFRPLPARGNRPAGIWQFMPTTARAQGLRIDARRDDRLGLVASTAAALRLLANLGDSFDGDWALATMAFNAGEFRVKRALASAGPDARSPQQLRLGATNRNHLARLRALACIVADPGGAGVVLDPLAADERLVVFPLLNGTTIAEAARDAGVAPARLRTLNAAPLETRLRAGEPFVLPRRAVAALATAQARARESADLPHTEYIVRAGDSLWTIARRHGSTVDELARHNRIDPARPLRPGQVLMLP
jgi:membrane-bound lytic murein transglycosylase D